MNFFFMPTFSALIETVYDQSTITAKTVNHPYQVISSFSSAFSSAFGS